ASFEIDLEPQRPVTVELTIQCSEEHPASPRSSDERHPQNPATLARTSTRPAATPPQEAFAALITRDERQIVNYASVHTSDTRFNDWLARSAADLRMMTTDTPYGPYPYAGVPWFN